MAIVVKHKKTGNEYILLAVNAINGGKINLPSRLNDLFSQNDAESEYGLATVCDRQGNMFLTYINDLMISEIDGKKPSEILPEVVVSSVSRQDSEDDDFEDDGDLEPGEPKTVSSEPVMPNNDDFEDDEDWV